MWLFFLMTATLYLTALALHRITIPYTVVAPPPHFPDFPPSPDCGYLYLYLYFYLPVLLFLL